MKKMGPKTKKLRKALRLHGAAGLATTRLAYHLFTKRELSEMDEFFVPGKRGPPWRKMRARLNRLYGESCDEIKNLKTRGARER